MLTPNASCTLYLQTGPGAYTRVYVPACFWQDGEDGVSIVIPGELPEQYKGEKREKDYVVQGERMGEVTGVSVSRTFTGFRRFGDAAQDAIMDRLYDLDNRKVKFIECYDNLGSGKPNGRQGEGVLSITDDGSGDAQNRENISFGLKILGTPQKGTVTIGEDGTPTFKPEAAAASAMVTAK